MSDKILSFRTKKTGVINTVIEGSVTHKRILSEAENYELMIESKKQEKSG